MTGPAAVDLARFHTAEAWGVAAACLIAVTLSGLRWLRVAQREHYLAGSCGRFAARWWTVTPLNGGLALVALAGAGLSVVWPAAGLATAVVVAAGPVGLTLRGRTSPLAWTRRLRTLAALWAVLELIVVGAGVGVGVAPVAAVVAALAVPFLVDLACAATAPFERRAGSRFVAQAAERLRRVHPTVVAVTGSYGKTSTKGHIGHLVGGSLAVVATPASFNNRAGLARAVNEHLADGTGVFVAEMGTYGPGEIADLCRWCPPQISVITAIGPVHLERFGSEDRIVEAKSEILATAGDVVLNVDDPRLAAVADGVAPPVRVLRCSAADTGADVCVVRGSAGTMTAWIAGEAVAADFAVPSGVQPGNLACAIAVAVVLGVPATDIAARLRTMPAVAHRLEATRGQAGFWILDDTYNSNPAGAAEGLAALGALGASRRAVVTPGMVELGRRQGDENRRFAAAAATVATDVVIVGRTNRRALVAGVGGASGNPVIHLVRDRNEAVGWVRANLGADDAVLYENDLPDHYP